MKRAYSIVFCLLILAVAAMADKDFNPSRKGVITADLKIKKKLCIFTENGTDAGYVEMKKIKLQRVSVDVLGRTGCRCYRGRGRGLPDGSCED